MGITFTSGWNPSLFEEGSTASSVDGNESSQRWIFLRHDVAAAHAGEWAWVDNGRLNIADDAADAPAQSFQITNLNIWDERSQMCRVGTHGWYRDRYGNEKRW